MSASASFGEILVVLAAGACAIAAGCMLLRGTSALAAALRAADRRTSFLLLTRRHRRPSGSACPEQETRNDPLHEPDCSGDRVPL